MAVESFEALLERCQAVAFAVPPDVQAELAIRAARAGRALLLDKPLALALEPAERLARAVEEAGVVTQLMLTHRFRSRTAGFLEQARGWDAFGRASPSSAARSSAGRTPVRGAASTGRSTTWAPTRSTCSTRRWGRSSRSPAAAIRDATWR